jgi:glycosyl transferase family 87
LLIFAPLAALPYPLAYVVWYCCNSLMLISVLLALWRHIPELHTRLPLLLFAGATAYPVLVSLSQGQDSILLLLLLTLCFLSLKKGQEFRAGIALGIGMFKFLLVGPIVLGLIVARRWRVLAAYGVTCGALLMASFALIGPQAATNYWSFLFHFSRVTPPLAKLSHMPCLRDFLHALAPRSIPAMWVDVVVIGLSVLILGFVLVRSAKAGRAEALDLRFSMLVTTAAVVSYHFFVHNATILLLPVLLTANHFAGPGRHAFARVLFLIGIATMYFAPFVIPEPADMMVFFCGSVVLLLILYLSTTRDASQEFGPASRLVMMQCRTAKS